jgi:DNA polymerase II small subunit/DNA polymerase delta subunit B
MSDIVEVIKSCLQRKSNFIKIQNQLPHYKINELRSFAKGHNLKIIGRKIEIPNTINDHLNYKISMCDHYIQWAQNVKRKKAVSLQY